VQKAAKRNPRVVELRRSAYEEPFPGLVGFSRRVGELPGLFPNWQERFTEARGVYLLVFEDGAQYVGSADGRGGFWQRWMGYTANGHGGNKVLKAQGMDARSATVTILEVAGSSTTREEILAREQLWMRKLGRRVVSLDNNPSRASSTSADH
jgi:hypothetical protein